MNLKSNLLQEIQGVSLLNQRWSSCVMTKQTELKNRNSPFIFNWFDLVWSSQWYGLYQLANCKEKKKMNNLFFFVPAVNTILVSRVHLTIPLWTKCKNNLVQYPCHCMVWYHCQKKPLKMTICLFDSWIRDP